LRLLTWQLPAADPEPVLVQRWPAQQQVQQQERLQGQQEVQQEVQQEGHHSQHAQSILGGSAFGMLCAYAFCQPPQQPRQLQMLQQPLQRVVAAALPPLQ
jgi:hypothetical protein